MMTLAVCPAISASNPTPNPPPTMPPHPQTMKQSPYYKNVREFQEEGDRWEEKLSQIQELFDAWVDVQRRWVYLSPLAHARLEA